MKPVDSHVHSIFSFDGHAPIEDMCRAAIEKGMTHMVVTDHCDYSINKKNGKGYIHYYEVQDERKRAFDATREKYSGKIELLYGVEIGNPKFHPILSKRLIREHEDEFDFILSSVHDVPNGPSRNIYDVPFTSKEAIEFMWKEYFDEMDYIVQKTDFDSIAHFDYPLRVMEKAAPECTIRPYIDRIDPIIRRVAQLGKALEINTHGATHWQKRVGPEVWVLQLFREYGGKYITIGSDSHSCEGLASAFDVAVKALSDAGFDCVTVYKNRKPVQLPIC